MVIKVKLLNVTERDPNPLETLAGRRTKRRTSSEPAPVTSPATDAGEGKEKAGRKSKKTKRDESKENDESKDAVDALIPSGKHNKKHKKKRTDEPCDLVIPVSPGLAIENAADDDEIASKGRAQRHQAVNASIGMRAFHSSMCDPAI